MGKKLKNFITEFRNQPKRRRILSLGGMISVLIALGVYLFLEFAVGEEALTFWPVWSFFIALFYTTGLFYVVYSIVGKSSVMLLIGLGCLILGTFFLLISFALTWSIVIIVSAALVIVLYGVTFMIRTTPKKDDNDVAEGYTDEPEEEKFDD